MSLRERARLGAVALGAGAAVLALIQILEQSVSAFNPRPVVSAMITLLVAMAGVSLARARTVSTRREFLSSALVESPMPTAAKADPLMLGVFRPRIEVDNGIGPYVPRSVDGALEQAIAGNRFVLLIGPARAGKSRSAYEVVRRVLPERELLIPYGGEALLSIISDPALRASQAVWWLDDLDRFLPSIDGPRLRELLEGNHVVVASLREQSWQALLQSDGDAGEHGRRLLADAFTVTMSAELTPDELTEGSQLYPGIDLSNGIGIALAAEGTASRIPVERLGTPASRAVRRFDLLLGLALAATAAVALVLAALVAGGGFSVSKPPPVAAQLEQVLGAGYRAGDQLVYYNLRADLHGLGQRSWIIVWRSRDGSEDLKIYDQDGGWLTRRLDFPVPASLQLVQHRLLNIDGFFENQLVTTFESRNPHTVGNEIPLLVTWNDTLGRYILAPLLPSAVRSLPSPETLAPWPGSTARVESEERAPVQLTYWSGSTYPVKAYPVASFAVVPAHRHKSAVLAVANVTNRSFQVKTGAFQFVAVTVFSLKPLVSTGDVPVLSCIWPGNDLFPSGWIWPSQHRTGGAELLPLQPNSGFEATDGITYATYSYSSLLARAAQTVSSNSLPCGRGGEGGPNPFDGGPSAVTAWLASLLTAVKRHASGTNLADDVQRTQRAWASGSNSACGRDVAFIADAKSQSGRKVSAAIAASLIARAETLKTGALCAR